MQALKAQSMNFPTPITRRTALASLGALPLLARGAAMRFLSSRAYDWLHTPTDALVTRKDPLAFARRLSFYRANPGVFG